MFGCFHTQKTTITCDFMFVDATHVYVFVFYVTSSALNLFSLKLLYSFMFLLLENYGVRKLEAVFAVLISTMALSFAWMFADAKPSTKELLIGQMLNYVLQI